MSTSKLRRQIAYHAARLMYERQESEYYRAKMKAARQLCRERVKPVDLPSNAEIRDEVQSMARLIEGDRRVENLRDMRLEALRIMRILAHFKPRLIGSVMTGHIRKGSDIDIHIFSDSLESVRSALETEAIAHDVEHKRVQKHGEERVFTHIHLQQRFPIELTMYAADLTHYGFKSSITGKRIERHSVRELELFLEEEYPNISIEDELLESENQIDRFLHYEMLLLPLEETKQSPKYHPEGDALYHSLQVFEAARFELPYDEEFLLAALLHDVGKAIDPYDHVQAGLEALAETITERTAWLIQNHMLAHSVLDGTIGAKAHRRLKENESYEELVLLCQCDEAGRQVGVPVPEVEETLDYIRQLSQECGDY
ncbi:MAG: DUF4269 domain-containing protein [Pirellulales bacterium]